VSIRQRGAPADLAITSRTIVTPAKEAVIQLVSTNMCRFRHLRPSSSRRRPGPIVRQVPDFESFLRPCLFGRHHAGWEKGPGLRRDDVICSEGALNTNWITPSKAGVRGWQGHFSARDSRFRAGLSGEILVARNRTPSSGRHNFSSPWPDLFRPPMSSSLTSRSGNKAWMAGPSPAKEDPALCKQPYAQPNSIPRTALRSRGNNDKSKQRRRWVAGGC
jgi:hypothetical protein